MILIVKGHRTKHLKTAIENIFFIAEILWYVIVGYKLNSK